MTMQLIQTITVGAAGASSIEFTNIPQNATDLLIVISGRTLSTAQNSILTLNGDTSDSNYLRNWFYGYGSTIYAEGGNTRVSYFTNGSFQVANSFGSSSIYIQNYSSISSKTVITEMSTPHTSTSSVGVGVGSLRWSNTAAITSCTLTGFDNFVQNSTASLYSITKGSDGITTVS